MERKIKEGAVTASYYMKVARWDRKLLITLSVNVARKQSCAVG